MKLIVSALLIAVLCILTCIIAAFQFYAIFSNRIFKDSFFKIRKKLAIARMILNLITLTVTFILGLYAVTSILAIITLNVIAIDVVFYLLEKMTTENKR